MTCFFSSHLPSAVPWFSEGILLREPHTWDYALDIDWAISILSDLKEGPGYINSQQRTDNWNLVYVILWNIAEFL